MSTAETWRVVFASGEVHSTRVITNAGGLYRIDHPSFIGAVGSAREAVALQYAVNEPVEIRGPNEKTTAEQIDELNDSIAALDATSNERWRTEVKRAVEDMRQRCLTACKAAEDGDEESMGDRDAGGAIRAAKYIKALKP